ncbi:kinase-like protein [Schizopora paradoxa]|uniref:Kinase-like protein n=1 Tax=Schizopora paradoxa TaxID=27342 RepID=A0A0H2SAH5_9AGAM|nr:kinase-like protein [Schizopora paradoxa]
MDKLELVLDGLSHLDLTGQVVDKEEDFAGFGGHCNLFIAWYEDAQRHHRTKVAVKQIRVSMREDTEFAKRLAKEIRIWSTLKHEYVLPLLGYFTEGKSLLPNLVSRWMENGALKVYMQTFPRGGQQTWDLLFKVASGLKYLHSNGIIHADLKSGNILISDEGNPLLCDFGISRLPQMTTTSSTRGTPRWMASELLQATHNGSRVKHDEKSDIWAFGMVIYELLSWKLPYYDLENDMFVISVIVAGHLPIAPEESESPRIFRSLWELACYCWRERTRRCPLSYILTFLAGLGGEFVCLRSK